MFAIKPDLAALALLPVPFVVLTAMRYNRLSRPALQEVQQRIAELTAEAEESISGIRIVKAFAREEHMLDRFRRSVGRVFDQNDLLDPPAGLLLAAARLPAEPRPGGGAAGRRPPGDQQHPLARRLHRLLHLPGHAHRPDADARHGAGDGAAGGRLGQPAVRDPRPRAADREPAGRAGACRRARAGSSCAASRSPTTAARPRWTDVELAVEAGRTVALVGPDRARARRAWWR